ncbi:MAG: ribosome-associated translation inhibitor RaiA [Planctomycetota bacterium]
MLFTITGKHVEITEAMKAHAYEKSSKLPRYYDRINKVEVIVDSSDKSKPSVEIIASAEHNKVFIARETGQDTYVCIDLAAHKLERQLARAKGKERDNKHVKLKEKEQEGEIGIAE